MTIKGIETEVINAIRKILDDYKIAHYVDYKEKAWGGDYYVGIYKNPTRLLFAHTYNRHNIGAITPLKLSPELIEKKYKINGTQTLYDPPSPTHYILFIPLEKGSNDKELINGKYTIEDKSDFFSDIAKLR
jgi:hypothetical protein